MANIPAWVYKLLIVLATIIWGFSFVVMKDVVAVLPPAWLLGMRFLFAGGRYIVIFVALAVLLHKGLRLRVHSQAPSTPIAGTGGIRPST